MRNSKTERENLEKALTALDQWFETHDDVETSFGRQYTVDGYQLVSVFITKHWIRLSVYVLNRSIKEKDLVRNGDEASFLYRMKTDTIEFNG